MEITSTDITTDNKTNIGLSNMNQYSFNVISLFLIILVLLLVIFFNDREFIYIQQYLNNLHKNSKILKDQFKSLVNPNYNKIVMSDKMILLENFLDDEYFNFLQSQFNNKSFNSLNYYYRKGNGVNFTNLHKSSEYNGFLELYYSDQMQNTLTNVLEKNIQRPPLSDINSCSLLIYSNQGDYIDWHKDYSNYYGDRYVVLLSLTNSNLKKQCCSENEFMFMEQNNSIGKLKLKPNCLLIFKGSEILHKSTSIGLGEQRILLSMTFCDICQEKKNIGYNIYESIKNTILYE